MASSPITSWQIEGTKVEAVTDFIFLGSEIPAIGDCRHELKILAPWKKSYDKPKQHIQKQKCYLAYEDPSNQCYGFSYSHVQM